KPVSKLPGQYLPAIFCLFGGNDSGHWRWVLLQNLFSARFGRRNFGHLCVGNDDCGLRRCFQLSWLTDCRIAVCGCIFSERRELESRRIPPEQPDRADSLERNVGCSDRDWRPLRRCALLSCPQTEQVSLGVCRDHVTWSGERFSRTGDGGLS